MNKNIIYVGVGLLVAGIAGGIGYYIYRKKKFNEVLLEEDLGAYTRDGYRELNAKSGKIDAEIKLNPDPEDSEIVKMTTEKPVIEEGGYDESEDEDADDVVEDDMTEEAEWYEANKHKEPVFVRKDVADDIPEGIDRNELYYFRRDGVFVEEGDEDLPIERPILNDLIGERQVNGILNPDKLAGIIEKYSYQTKNKDICVTVVNYQYPTIYTIYIYGKSWEEEYGK